VNKLRELLARARAFYSGLKPRERYFVLAGAAALLAFALALTLTGGKKSGPKRSKVSTLYRQRDEFFATADRYDELKVLLDRIDGRLKQRPENFDLFAKLNELSDQTGVRAAVIKMDPGQSTSRDYLDEDYVDLNLQKIDLVSLVRFLERVEAVPGLVRIGQLSIKTRFDNSNTLDVVMRISAYREKPGGPKKKETRMREEALVPEGSR
jgi:hypothetical protein